MRTTIDIPDETYRSLKIKAAQRGTSVRALVLESLEIAAEAKQTLPRKRFEIPVIRSKHKDKLVIDNEKIYELIDFP
jgi:plasmid stability protein